MFKVLFQMYYQWLIFREENNHNDINTLKYLVNDFKVSNSLSSFCSLSFLRIIANPNYFNNFFFIKIFKPCTCEYIVVTFLNKKKTCRLKSLTIKFVGIFENLTNRINCDILCKNLFTFFLKTSNTESIS